MSYQIKNITSNDIEIQDRGFTVQANSIYDASDFQVSSNDLTAYIENGLIVFVDEEGNEHTAEDSIDFLAVTRNSDFDSFALKEELDDAVTLIESSIESQINALIGGAPGALDTLNEIANALNDNADFQAYVVNALAQKSEITHNHDSSYYMKGAVDSLLSTKANSSHDHSTLYYLKSTIDTLLADKSNTAHNHDSAYYLKSAIDSLLLNKSNTTHNHDDRYELKGTGGSSIFGSNFFNYENDDIITMNSGRNLSIHDSTQVVVQSSGLYRLGWSYSWNCNTTSDKFIGVIEFNNTDVHRIEVESKDAGGDFYSTGTSSKRFCSGFKYLDLVPGTYTIKLFAGVDDNNILFSTWDRRIEFWRVS